MLVLLILSEHLIDLICVAVLLGQILQLLLLKLLLLLVGHYLLLGLNELLNDGYVDVWGWSSSGASLDQLLLDAPEDAFDVDRRNGETCVGLAGDLGLSNLLLLYCYCCQWLLQWLLHNILDRVIDQLLLLLHYLLWLRYQLLGHHDILGHQRFLLFSLFVLQESQEYFSQIGLTCLL